MNWGGGGGGCVGMISQGAGFSLQLVVQEDSFRGIAAFVDVSVHVFVSIGLSTVVEKKFGNLLISRCTFTHTHSWTGVSLLILLLRSHVYFFLSQ